ncbi:MAG: hypothetical protein F4Y53_02490 [Proteobacteria bacterium]|nr:hypothetical protein [Pseudomonadota bacterium]
MTAAPPPTNWQNRTIWTGDCLEIMRGMNGQSVDLIYLDPPFNSKADYAAPIGSEAAGAAFRDTWTLSDIDVEWINLIESKHPALYRVLLAASTKSDKSYLVYMAPRLLEMHRILKDTGSIYLHCDWHMAHWLRIVLDTIFGKPNFKNEIVWCYTGPSNTKRYYPRKHDTLFFYTKGPGWKFNAENIRVPYKQLNTQRGVNQAKDPTKGIGGDLTIENVEAYREKGKIPESWWPEFSPVGRRKSERVGYPTQKPLALLDRIIRASSNAGDVVLDPFCGCATTCVMADALDRHWIGIDISPKAAELVRQRINDLTREIVTRSDIPKRTDMGKLPPYNSKANHAKLYGDQGGYCNGCNTHFEPRHFEVDHIIARAKGGTDHLDNLQLLCGSCNRIKGDRGMDYLRAKLSL